MNLTPRFNEALKYAATIHSEHNRKGTEIPYISHLLGVTSLVIEHGGNEDEAIAGLLHDAVEDAGGKPRLEDITRRFGENVARIVVGCTDADPILGIPWRQRKEAYIAGLEYADDSILLVSVADKLHNARAILGDYRERGDDLWNRFDAGKADKLWYYRTLRSLFNEKQSKRIAPLCAELDRTVSELEKMARM